MGSQRFRALLLVLCLPVLFAMGCGGFKGVVTPTLTSISPSTIAAHSAGFTLTVTGTNFTRGTKIVMDGVAQATTVVSNTQLTSAVSAAKIASPGTIVVGVIKADTTSSVTVLPLTVTGHPAQLNSISPSTVAAGSADFTLTATGTGFASGNMISWNGVAVQTTFDSATQLHATITAAQIVLPGSVNVGVIDAANTLSNELPFTITGTGPGTGATPPTLASLNPSTVVAGAPSFTLTVTGTNFVAGSQVTWEGVALASTFVSGTQLTATIPAALIALAESVSVAVLNPNSTISNSVTFIISANPDVTPNLTSITANPILTPITPSSVPVGCGGATVCTVTLVGTNFDQAAFAESINAGVITKLVTTFISPTQLSVVIPASWLLDIGQYPINVVNPYSAPAAPRLSNVVAFYVGIVIRFGEIKDVVWDAKRQLFYVSIPGDATSNANTIAAVTPAGVAKYYAVAGNPAHPAADPDRLAISDDGQFLYVGLDGTGEVAQYLLQNASPYITTPIRLGIGADPNLGPFSALDIQVAPGVPNTVAVARGIQGPTEQALGGIAVYDFAGHTVVYSTPPLAASVLLDTVQWADATTLFAADNEKTGDLYQFSVTSTAVTVAGHFAAYYLPLPNIRIHFDAKMLYGDDGVVADLTSAPPAKTSFSAQGIMVPDSGLAKAFFLGQNQTQVNTVSYSLDSFSLATKTAPLKDIPLYSIVGSPQHMVRWGTNGLAFSTANIVDPITKSTRSTGALYILSGPFVAP